MLMNQILDSPNSLRDPDKRSRPLKRSASVASLPTPPRTEHKRSRSRGRSSVSHHDSDDSASASELDDDLGGGYAERVKRAKTTRNSKSVSDDEELSKDESPDRKKRRTLGVLPGHDEDEEDENAFWTGRVGPSRGEKQEKKAAETDKTEESSPSPAMLHYRVRAPVSPPPSRRQPLIQPARAASVECEESLTVSAIPVTPPRKLFLRASPPAATTFKTPTKPKSTKIWPKRDSPNNPFLVGGSSEKAKLYSEWDSSEDEEVVGEARVREGTPTPTFEEKPTITYVFRGQKATFHNPLYGLAPEVIAASKLPIDHPDYEAAEACPPRRLFSVGKRKSRDRSRENTSTDGVKRAKVQLLESDRDETPEGDESGNTIESHKRLSHVDNTETEIVPSKPTREPSSHQIDDEELQSVREERERRETAAKIRLASRDGLRTGAVFAERDEPARRAMGPLRSA